MDFKNILIVGLQFGISPKWSFPQFLETGSKYGIWLSHGYKSNWRRKKETALSWGIIYMDDYVGWWPSPSYKVRFKVRDRDRILIEFDGPSRRVIFYNMTSGKVAIIKKCPRTHYKFIASVGWRDRQQLEFL